MDVAATPLGPACHQRDGGSPEPAAGGDGAIRASADGASADGAIGDGGGGVLGA